MDETAIYDFRGLKALLQRKGIRVGKAKHWREINSEEVSIKDGKLEFTDDGIFVNEDGIKRQVFLYKRAMYLTYNGEKKKPKFHICKCSKIQEYLNGNDIPEYRRANTRTVRVLDKSNGYRETTVSDLPICGYCASQLRKSNYLDSGEFSEVLRNAADVEPIKPKIVVGPDGYTKDWQIISADFRAKHNYTCEKCGIQVSPFDHAFVEVHHKNKNKTDNRPNNLQCLCIKCHSEVDATHIHNFSTPSKRVLIKLFEEKYRAK